MKKFFFSLLLLVAATQGGVVAKATSDLNDCKKRELAKALQARSEITVLIEENKLWDFVKSIEVGHCTPGYVFELFERHFPSLVAPKPECGVVFSFANRTTEKRFYAWMLRKFPDNALLGNYITEKNQSVWMCTQKNSIH